MTTRRSFIGSILALGAAPAIVRADSLMRVVPVSAGIWVPDVAIQPCSAAIIRETLAILAARPFPFAPSPGSVGDWTPDMIERYSVKVRAPNRLRFFAGHAIPA